MDVRIRTFLKLPLVILVGAVFWVRISASLQLKFKPPDGAFFVKFDSRNFHDKFLNSRQKSTSGLHPFLLHGCPKPKQILQATQAGQRSSVPLRWLISNSRQKGAYNNLNISGINYNCGVTVKLVNTVVTKDFPTVRLLVYVDTEVWKEIYSNLQNDAQDSVTVVVYANYKSEKVYETCEIYEIFTNSPIFTCIIRLVIPYFWWPAVRKSDENETVKKPTKNFLTLSYDVVLAANLNSNNGGGHFDLGTVELSPLTNFYKVGIDQVLTTLVPNSQYFKGLVFSVPVYFRYNPSKMEMSLHLFKLRCRVKEGLKILKVEEVPTSGWTVKPELNFKNTTATLSAFYRGYIALNETWSGQVLTIIIEVVDYPKQSPSAEIDGKIRPLPRAELTWSVRYVFAEVSASQLREAWRSTTSKTPAKVDDLFNSTMENITATTTHSTMSFGTQSDQVSQRLSTLEPRKKLAEQLNNQRKVITHLRVEKDTVYAVVPVSSNFDLINTAVLTGEQVSQTLKIFSITYTGQITDVTLQSSCIADQPSILKVTPSCTAVYLDGSETRGEVNSSILVEFGTHRTTASFTVWYPVIPMHVALSDPVLHAVKGWRLPLPKKPLPQHRLLRRRRKKRQQLKTGRHFSAKSSEENFNCRLRYQEAEIQIFAQFRIEDLKTGRRSFLGGQGQDLLLDVTDLANRQLKVSDESVARIYRSAEDGKIVVYGVSPGQTEVKFVSPLVGYVFGSAKLDVTNEKVGLRQLRALVIAGLNLTVEPVDNAVHPSGLVRYNAVAKVRMSQTFTRRYQPGSLSLSVQYSDGMLSSLSDINPKSFHLNAWSRDTDQVVFISKSQHSRSYTSQGMGPVPGFLVINDRTGGIPVEVELRSPEICPKPDHTALLHTTAFVEMSFHQHQHLLIFRGDEERALSSPAAEIPLEESLWAAGVKNIDTSREALKEPRTKSRNTKPAVYPTEDSGYTPGEVVLLVLLAVLALAGSVVALNCLIYGPKNQSYKFHRLVPGFIRLPRSSSESVTPCQEWVWLSRDQLEGNSSSGCRPQKRYSAIANNSHASLLSGCYCPLKQNLNSPPDEDEESTDFIKFSDNQFSVVQSSLASRSSAGSANAVRSHNRVSYQGSEVSIHIAPQPCMEIHPHRYYTGPPGNRHGHYRRAASWNISSRSLGSRMRITSNPIIDSSSEQNLSTIAPLSPLAGSETMTAKSEGEMGWDSRSLGLSETELRDYFSSLRETMA